MHELFALNLNSTKVLLLSFVPSFVNFGVFLYSAFFLPRKRINIVFSVFVLFLGLGQLTDGFIRLSDSEETAMLWNRISQVQWIFIPPLGLFFALKFTGLSKKLSHGLVFSLLFLPTIVLEMMMVAQLDKYSIVRSDSWGWVLNPRSSIVTTLIYGWMTVVAFAMLIVLWLYHYKAEVSKDKKKQGLLLAIGFSFPFVGGAICEVFFPLMLGIDSIPITAPLVTVFSVFAIIAIKKFSMLDYSPRHQWRTIIESMNEGVLIVDNFDRIMYANSTFCKLLEYDFSEIKEKVAHELFLYGDDRKLLWDAIEERNNNLPGQYEVRLRTKTGKTIWVLMNGSPYLDKNGRIIGSIGVQTNITRQKELEKSLKDNNARLKSAQAIARVGSWELDFASGVAIWSEEALRIYGLDQTQMTQSYEQWISFIHPDDLSHVQREIERSQRSLTDSSFEYRIVRRDGTVRHIHSISKFELDATGAPTGLFGVCHDITERKESERKLNELSERLLLATDSAHIGIYDWDLINQKLVWDKNMYSLFNTAPGDGDPVEIFEKMILPDDKLFLELETAAAVDNSKELHSVFRIALGAGREIRYIETHGVILRNNENIPIRMIGVNWDITKQKMAEDKIKQSEKRIRSFAKHLNKLQEEERAHIAREIHDELGQQLVGIKIALVSFLKNNGDDEMNEKTKNMVESVDESIQSLRKIATQLRPGILDTLGLASSIEWLCKEFGRKTGITPEVEIDISQQKFEKCVSICFFRICQEALTNVSKHSEADKIKISVVQKNKELTLVISDNGKGIANDKLRNPFSMGLLGMRERAKNISGDLKIKSRQGQGTVIQLKVTI